MTLRLRQGISLRPPWVHFSLLLFLSLWLTGSVAFALTEAPQHLHLENEGAVLTTETPLTLQGPLPDHPFERFVAEFVTAQGGGYTFFLEPASARGGSFVVKTQVSGGAFQTHLPGTPKTYRGTVLEIPGSRVAASLLAGGIHALVLVPDDDDLFIFPSSSTSASRAEPGAYSMMRAAVVSGGAVSDGAVSDGAISDRVAFDLAVFEPTGLASTMTTTGADCAADGFCIAELALDSTWPFYSSLGSSVEAVVDVVEGAVNMANVRFEDQFNIRHLMSGLLVRTSQADDPYLGASNGLAVMSLEWGASDHPDISRDHIHLMGFGSGGQTVQAGVVCYSSSNRSYSSGSRLNFATVGILIHELGHAWGSDHDLCGGVMTAASGNPTLPFCGSSLVDIVDYRDVLSCLDPFTPDSLIFADGFESNDLTGWPVSFDPDGRLQVVSSGALFGSYSLEVDLSGSGAAWVRDELATLEPSYKARFHLDARGMLGGILNGITGPVVRAFEATAANGSAVAWLELRRVSGLVPLEMRWSARDDQGMVSSSPWTGVYQASNGPVEIVVKWKAATAVGANDGLAILKVEGSIISNLSGLDNDELNVDSSRLGVVAAPSGTFKKQEHLVFDGFESRRGDGFGPPQ